MRRCLGKAYSRARLKKDSAQGGDPMLTEVPAYCPVCQRQVLARRKPPNHIFNLIMSVVTVARRVRGAT